MKFLDEMQPYSCTHFFAGLNIRLHGSLDFAGLPLMLDGETVGAAFKTARHSVTCIFDKRHRGTLSLLRITKADIVIRDGAVQITLPKSDARRVVTALRNAA